MPKMKDKALDKAGKGKGEDKDSVREVSFGASPPVLSLEGGATMPTFGWKTHDPVWPKETEPVNTKTGYPEGRSTGGINSGGIGKRKKMA